MKLLVVDDDQYAREGMLACIPAERLGITQVMQAKDGQVALQMARWFGPDIVITDISMPRMDGLAFARTLKALLPQVQLILITGYVQVEYLREAIALSVVAFVEKPMQPALLVRAVEQAVARWRERRQGEQHSQSLRTLKRQQVATMLNRNDKDIDEVRALCAQVGFPADAAYCCAAIRVPPQQGDVYAMVDRVAQCCEGAGFACVIEPREDGFLIAVLARPKMAHADIARLTAQLLRQIPDSRIGLGTVVPALEAVHTSRKAAKSTLDHAFYDEGQRVFTAADLPGDIRALDAGVYAQFSRLLAEDTGGLAAWTSALMERIARQRPGRIEEVRELVLSMLLALHRQNPAIYGRVYGIGRAAEIEAYVYSAQGLSQLRDYLLAVIGEVETHERDASQFSRVIRSAKRYVAQHFSEQDCGLHSIAAHVNFSPAYLNVIFKAETGMTVKQYLIEVRMQMAQRMLREGNTRVADIALTCGYSNANYFSKAFKEYAGVTPGEYREN